LRGNPPSQAGDPGARGRRHAELAGKAHHVGGGPACDPHQRVLHRITALAFDQQPTRLCVAFGHAGERSLRRAPACVSNAIDGEHLDVQDGQQLEAVQLGGCSPPFVRRVAGQKRRRFWHVGRLRRLRLRVDRTPGWIAAKNSQVVWDRRRARHGRFPLAAV